jgi:hypothetical protein
MTRDPEPLGSFWYVDGVQVWRCKICERPQAEIHGPLCALGQGKALVAALVESEEPMHVLDIQRVLRLADVLGVPVKTKPAA